MTLKTIALCLCLLLCMPTAMAEPATLEAYSELEYPNSLGRFIADDDDLRAVAALQGVTLLMPETPPEGYARADWASLRKTHYGVITEAQEAFTAFFTEENALREADGRLWYDVPLEMLDDLTYIGVMYYPVPKQEDGIMFLARIVTPDTLTPMRHLINFEDGTVRSGVEHHTLPDGRIAMVERRGDDKTSVIFVYCIDAETIEAIRDAERKDEPIITYEISSETAPLESLLTLWESMK